MNQNETVTTTGENYTGPKPDWKPEPHEAERYEAWAESRLRIENLSKKMLGDPRAGILKKMADLGIEIFGKPTENVEPQPELREEYERRRAEHNEKFPLPCPILRAVARLPEIQKDLLVGCMPAPDDDTIFRRYCILVGSLIMTSLEVAKESRQVVQDLSLYLNGPFGAAAFNVIDEFKARMMIESALETWKPDAKTDFWKFFETVQSAQSREYREKREYFEDLGVRILEKVGNET